MLGLCPAGAIFKALDDLFILCYTFSVKKEVLSVVQREKLSIQQTIAVGDGANEKGG